MPAEFFLFLFQYPNNRICYQKYLWFIAIEETLLLRKKSSNVSLVFFVLFCGRIQMCTSKNLLFPCDN